MKSGWEALFASYPAFIRPSARPKPLGNAGGTSGSSLYRFQSRRGLLLARCWPADGPCPARLARIHGWLRKSGGLSFVPVPIPTLDGRTVVDFAGRLWEVGPWMPGKADLERPPCPERIRGMFAGLAAFLGRLEPDRLEGLSPGLTTRAEELERLLLGEFDALGSEAARRPHDPASDLTRSWLARATQAAPRVLSSTRKAAGLPMLLQPCLRDARPDHFLFDGDRLSGLVDFGAMDCDTIAGDLARLLDESIGPDRSKRGDALSAFEAIRPLSELELRSIDFFRQANALLGPARWARWHFLEGRTFESPDAVVEGLRRGIRRLDEASGSRFLRI